MADVVPASFIAMDSPNTSTIVIVGAGIAGIAAANYLAKAGHTDFVILEARDRVGGRICTQQHGDGVIDIGAQYIHGMEGNPLYDLALQLDNVVDDEDSTSSDSESWHKTNNYYTPEGKLIDRTIVQEVHDVIKEILDDGNKVSREGFPDEAEDSIGSFLHRQFDKYLRTTNDDDAVRRMKERIFNWCILSEKAENACRSVYEMSLYAWGEYLECGGNPEIELKHGFQPLLEELLKSVPKDKVRLKTPVTAIYWDRGLCQPPHTCGHDERPRKSGASMCLHGTKPSSASPKKILPHFTDNSTLKENSSGATDHVEVMRTVGNKIDVQPSTNPSRVTVQTASGSTITADHVIITCPLGYLKKHAHSMFRPLLPNEKLAAIHRMGFGTVDKIFLNFPEAFWDKDCEGIQFAWLTDEPFVLNCVDNTHAAEYLHHDWYRSIQGLNVVAGHPTLLEGWIASDEAQIMETVPEDVVLNVCHELLQRFLGNNSIPKPTKIIRSLWHHEPYSWGSYSYIKMGSTAADCDILAKPLPSTENPCVLFAGEATHRTYFSTVHGAMLSGQREAQRIIDISVQDGPIAA